MKEKVCGVTGHREIPAEYREQAEQGLRCEMCIRDRTETDEGFHEMSGLLAKGYFVKEKTAPEGHKLDPNAYYLSLIHI